MACSAPIDIPTKKTVNSISGRFVCVYDPNMISGEPVTLSADLSHLSIKCTTNNSSKVVFFNAGAYTPVEMRVYKPSLHTYNGVPADAELLIVHSGSSSKSTDGLIVSVPIAMGGNKRSGLNTIVASANALNAGTVAMNPSAPILSTVDVNELIPSKPFYVYNGTLPYESCGGNYYYAVFTDPITISTPINNLTPSGIKTAPPPALIQKCKTPPTDGSAGEANDDEFALFEFVDTEDYDQKNKQLRQPDLPTKPPATPLNVLWGLLIAAAIGIIYWIFTSYKEEISAVTAMVTGAINSEFPPPQPSAPELND
jgi:carbonic anhydrase